MNKEQAIIRAKYATECANAKRLGTRKPDWEEWKKLYNYGSITTITNIVPEYTPRSTAQAIKNNARRQEKTLKQLNITIKNVVQQADILDDFFQEIASKHPEYNTYHKLSDYIFSSILDISEKIQTL